MCVRAPRIAAIVSLYPQRQCQAYMHAHGHSYMHIRTCTHACMQARIHMHTHMHSAMACGDVQGLGCSHACAHYAAIPGCARQVLQISKMPSCRFAGRHHTRCQYLWTLSAGRMERRSHGSSLPVTVTRALAAVSVWYCHENRTSRTACLQEWFQAGWNRLTWQT